MGCKSGVAAWVYNEFVAGREAGGKIINDLLMISRWPGGQRKKNQNFPKFKMSKIYYCYNNNNNNNNNNCYDPY